MSDYPGLRALANEHDNPEHRKGCAGCTLARALLAALDGLERGHYLRDLETADVFERLIALEKEAGQ